MNELFNAALDVQSTKQIPKSDKFIQLLVPENSFKDLVLGNVSFSQIRGWATNLIENADEDADFEDAEYLGTELNRILVNNALDLSQKAMAWKDKEK
jgi:hypothetical protein